MKKRFVSAIIAVFMLCLLAQADTLTGKVVSIADGDTITILDSANKQHKIRLQGIDAPESNQPFGAVSGKHLGALVHERQATVEYSKLDKYGRVVGKVIVEGKDVCLEQLRAGLAWFYREYQNELSEPDRKAYADAEAEAKAAKRGLWSESNPVAPWEFRHPVATPASSTAKTEQDKEETVYITKTGKKYHREDCRYLSRSKIAIKRKDAIARGYTPCSVCKP